jgi:hypothetical protein
MRNMLSDDAITSISVKHLQKMMDTAEYTEEEQEGVRLQRRKIQNRNSAKASANRKTKQLTAVLNSNEHLSAALEDLKTRNVQLEHNLAEANQVRGVAVDLARQNMHFQKEIGLLTTLLDRAERSPAVRVSQPLMGGARTVQLGPALAPAYNPARAAVAAAAYAPASAAVAAAAYGPASAAVAAVAAAAAVPPQSRMVDHMAIAHPPLPSVNRCDSPFTANHLSTEIGGAIGGRALPPEINMLAQAPPPEINMLAQAPPPEINMLARAPPPEINMLAQAPPPEINILAQALPPAINNAQLLATALSPFPTDVTGAAFARSASLALHTGATPDGGFQAFSHGIHPFDNLKLKTEYGAAPPPRVLQQPRS